MTNIFSPKVYVQPGNTWVIASFTFVCQGEPSKSPGPSHYPMSVFLLAIVSHFQKSIIHSSFSYRQFQNFRFLFHPWVVPQSHSSRTVLHLKSLAWISCSFSQPWWSSFIEDCRVPFPPVIHVIVTSNSPREMSFQVFEGFFFFFPQKYNLSHDWLFSWPGIWAQAHSLQNNSTEQFASFDNSSTMPLTLTRT